MIRLSRGDETSRTVGPLKFTSHQLFRLPECVFGILWVPFSNHRVLIENGGPGIHKIPLSTASQWSGETQNGNVRGSEKIYGARMCRLVTSGVCKWRNRVGIDQRNSLRQIK